MTGPTRAGRMLDSLGRQVASPVQFVKGLHTLYEAGARVFVEVGPKRTLQGFAEDVLGAEHDDVLTLFTNHPEERRPAVLQCRALRPVRGWPRISGPRCRPPPSRPTAVSNHHAGESHAC